MHVIDLSPCVPFFANVSGLHEDLVESILVFVDPNNRTVFIHDTGHRMRMGTHHEDFEQLVLSQFDKHRNTVRTSQLIPIIPGSIFEAVNQTKGNNV